MEAKFDNLYCLAYVFCFVFFTMDTNLYWVYKNTEVHCLETFGYFKTFQLTTKSQNSDD